MPYKEGRKWRGTVMIDGVRRQRTFSTKGEAARWEVAERERIRRISSEPTATDLLTLCNRYLDYIEPRVTGKVFGEKKALARTILGAWGNPPVLAITPEMVSDYLSAQAAARSNNAANKDRKNLLALFNWGLKVLGIPHNPVRSISRLPHQRAVQYTPSQEDMLKVLAAATREEEVFLRCYLQTGARRSEIFRLTWEDVNFEKRTITLATRKTRGGEMRRDPLPMTDGLAAELKWWYETPERKFRDQPWVFVDHHSGPNTGHPYKVRRRFLASLCERAGVRPFGFHALRRFVASYLADVEKVSSKVIQRILRHGSVRTTERYLDRLFSDLRGTVNLLDRVGVKSGVKRSGKAVENGE